VTATAHTVSPGQGRRWWYPVLRYLVLIGGNALCLLAGWFEYTRAEQGHAVAWVYVFEWPLYAVLGSYIWWRVGRPDRRRRDRPARRGDRIDPDDPDLQAWQAYLARLDSGDEAGRPPVERR